MKVLDWSILLIVFVTLVALGMSFILTLVIMWLSRRNNDKEEEQ